MAGMNLHGIVRNAITSVHPDETVTYYKSAGQKNISGRIKAVYEAPIQVRAQVQSLSDSGLQHTNITGYNTPSIRVYMYADTWNAPYAVLRPFARNGDILLRTNGTYWEVTGVPDNFELVEWVCVSAVLMTAPPDFSYSDWSQENGG